MKFSPLIAPSIVLLVIAYNQTFAGSGDTAANTQAATSTRAEHVAQLAATCHQGWQKMDWVLGHTGTSAKDNPAFSQGMVRVCRARAELFFEGYEISPFIEPGSQQQILPIVFRPSIEEIKDQFRLHLPKLRLI